MSGDPLPFWVSPSNAWRLLDCPASHRKGIAGEALAAPQPDNHQLPNAGTLAHRAVEHWVKSGEYRDDPDGARLVSHFDEACATYGLLASSIRAGVSTRARLKVRAPDLSRALRSDEDGSEVLTELPLQDDDLMIRGTADLVTTGIHKSVMDLKTGSLNSGEVPDDMRLQLALYSHLYSVTFGGLPEEVLVLSLQRGVLPVLVDEDAIQGVLGLVADARQNVESPPRPSVETCRYCNRRPVCDEHWMAIVGWEHPDGFEGRVEKVEVADAGILAIQVTSSAQTLWLTQISPSMVMGGLSVGSLIRAVRASRSSQPEDGESSALWRCGPSSEIRILD